MKEVKYIGCKSGWEDNKKGGIDSIYDEGETQYKWKFWDS